MAGAVKDPHGLKADRLLMDRRIIELSHQRIPTHEIVAQLQADPVYSQMGIAISANRCYRTIRKWLDALAQDAKETTERWRARELAALDRRERQLEAERIEALAAYERSKTAKTVKKSKRIGRLPKGAAPGAQPAIDQVELSESTEAQAGDPRWAEVLLRNHAERNAILDRRAKLLGLYTPQKVALTDPTGELAAAFADIPLATLREILRSAGEPRDETPSSNV